MTLVYIAVFAIALGHLYYGWRDQRMSAMGGVYATADREKRPIRYWLFAVYNVLMALAGILLFVAEIRQ